MIRKKKFTLIPLEMTEDDVPKVVFEPKEAFNFNEKSIFKHLIKVRFRDDKNQTYPQVRFILSQFDNWENIPRLAILTGRNGSGKSLLLSYIGSIIHVYNANFKENNEDKRISYLYYERQFSIYLNDSINGSSNFSSLWKIRLILFKNDKKIGEVLLDLFDKYCSNSPKTYRTHFDEFKKESIEFFKK